MAKHETHIIVQKFGGAILAKPELRQNCINKILEAYQQGLKVVAVISAIGRAPEPYATDSLLDLLQEAGHLPPDAREKDLLMSCGEIIAVVLIAHLIRARGTPAVALTGFQAGIHTNHEHGNALILDVNPVRVLKELAEGKIVVVAGFQGMTDNLELTTLGRDGSDITALALGKTLHADRVEIYKDSDGIRTLDPKFSAQARLIPELTYEEAGEMADEGAKVLHKRAVLLAKAGEIPVMVNSLYADTSGTKLCSVPAPLEETKIVSSVVCIPGVVQLEICFNSGDIYQLRTEIFNRLADEDISLDIINICNHKLYFIVTSQHIDKVEAVLKALNLDYHKREKLAKLAIVGIGMKGTPGVMAKIQTALYEAQVALLHATDSHITISCLINEYDISKAIEALSRKFNLTL